MNARISEKGEFVIFNPSDGLPEIHVRLENETIWMPQGQISLLFETDRTSVQKHIKNILDSGELVEQATCANFAQVQKEGSRTITRGILHYNLDMILSVGYRVNSKRGTQFRMWASRILKDHLVKGYTLNEKRLREKTEEIELLKKSLSIVERSLKTQVESLEQARNLVSFLSEFSCGLGILDDYDHEKLDKDGITVKAAVRVTVAECLDVIAQMKHKFESGVFAVPKDESFESSVNQIFQSFSGKDVYPSIEEKAAMLLYFVVKNHSFVDGNKRIAASLFLYFLSRNKRLYGEGGIPILSNEGLAAITLLIAESKSEEMETIKRVVVTMLNRGMV